MTATVTADFRDEFEAERGKRLRRRFLWWTGVLLALSVIAVFAALVALLFANHVTNVENTRGLALVAVLFSIATTIPYAWGLTHVRKRLPARDVVVQMVFWIILANGVIALARSVVSYELSAPLGNIHVTDTAPAQNDITIAQFGDQTTPPAGQKGSPNVVAIGALTSIFIAHVFACFFLPLTVKESIRPVLPVLALSAVVTLIYAKGVRAPALVIALSPLIAAPGATICAWRHGRFRKRFHLHKLRSVYGEMKRELTDARRIHEALFPEPMRNGPVRFAYRYEPMHQIGGDFVFSHQFNGLDGEVDVTAEPLSLVIIDVTGHGIPAALTVNRLQGELERLFAEDPDIPPGDVLESLNRYVHLTLARHSVYATAMCLRVDPTAQTLAYASGGHPPAFVRTVDGRMDQLDSTSFVLGACADTDFDAGERTMRFGLGDAMIAYTDGAIESCDNTGAMLGVAGMQKIVLGARPDPGVDGGLAPAILRAVDERRAGPLMDDTLVVEVYRPLGA